MGTTFCDYVSRSLNIYCKICLALVDGVGTVQLKSMHFRVYRFCLKFVVRLSALARNSRIW